MLIRLLLSLAACAALTAFASAQEGAYRVLLSMGRAAATDRGPQVGELPYDRAGAARSESGPAMRPEGFAVLSPTGALNEFASAAPAEALSDAAASEPAPALNSQAARMKRWALRLLRLSPSPRRARPGRDAVAPRGRRLVSRAVPPGQDGAASRDGARRGFFELLAVASCDLP